MWSERLGQYSYKTNRKGGRVVHDYYYYRCTVSERNLERLAKRGMMGLARTGGIASNGSGDYVLALSVAPENLVRNTPLYTPSYLHNDDCSSLFMAAIEATEEAILNSLFAAETMTGIGGRTVEALPAEKVAAFFK